MIELSWWPALQRRQTSHDIAFAFPGVARSTATAYNGFHLELEDDDAAPGLTRVCCWWSPLVVSVPAYADIYTWTDKSGTVNVSNLPPPEDAASPR